MAARGLADAVESAAVGIVRTRGASIFFEEFGAGPPLVLMHSFLCSGAMWAPVVPAMASAHRVINVDLRGHGQSSAIESSITIYDLMADCLAVLDELRIRSAVWIGLSIGGMIALRAALEAPERVTSLVLLGSDAGAEGFLQRLQFQAMSVATRVAGVRPLLPEICRRMFARSTRRQNPALIAEWRERFGAADAPSMRRALTALMARDSLLDRLGRIAVPALVIVGEEDVSLPPSRSRAIDAALPNSELKIVPGAGHLSTLEKPDAVGRLITDFLRRVAV